MKLSELLKRITPLPWLKNTLPDDALGNRDVTYARHAANVLPELVRELDNVVAVLESIGRNEPRFNAPSTISEAKRALARADEVPE